MEQGYTNKVVYDCYSEVKERKITISGVSEFPGENTAVVALGCINKVIEAAIKMKHPDAHLEGLRKLQYDSIDKAFRLGKAGKNRKRIIVVTLMRIADKDMIFKAKSDIKDNANIKFYLNDDVSSEGGILKAKLRRIVSVAKSLGREAKLTGNKVIIGSRYYASNELHLLPKDIADNLKQEKEIDDGVVYRGELSTFSNFCPAPFVLDDKSYAHVEQHYQYCKAIHHDEVETAEAILSLSNPMRIKALGDGIQSDGGWLDRRMLVLYEGVRAKFEQNLALQDELLSTDGKHLYEATTDTYFGCGLGYDSKRWQLKDWNGENVAGLVLKKVRDELLGVFPEEGDKNNTLIEIASQDDAGSIEEMESSGCQDKSYDDISAPVESCLSESDLQNRSTETEDRISQHQDRYNTPLYGHSQRGKKKGRGRGRGRGRANGNGNPQRNQLSNSRRNSMSAADRNFLRLKEKQNNIYSSNTIPKKHDRSTPTPSPNSMTWSSLSDKQKKGLAELGLTPDLFQSEGKHLSSATSTKA